MTGRPLALDRWDRLPTDARLVLAGRLVGMIRRTLERRYRKEVTDRALAATVRTWIGELDELGDLLVELDRRRHD